MPRHTPVSTPCAYCGRAGRYVRLEYALGTNGSVFPVCVNVEKCEEQILVNLGMTKREYRARGRHVSTA